jgi:hypothetical protein
MRSCPQSPECCPRCVGMTVRDGPESAHELSIWQKTCSQKVLNVTWDDAGKMELITYEPGEWEKDLAQG